MKCPGCETEISDQMTCPVCGAIRSEDYFDSSPESRTDTEHRLALGGHRMVMSRHDLKSFIALLLLTLAVMVYALLTLELRIDGGFYLVFGVFTLAAIYIGRNFVPRMRTGRRQGILLAIAVAVICAGLATLASSKYLQDTLGPEDGSAEYVSTMTDRYQSYDDYGFIICVIGVLFGLSVLLGGKLNMKGRGSGV